MDSRDSRLRELFGEDFGGAVDRLRAEVERLTAEGRAAWPALGLDDDAFWAHLALHAPTLDDLARVRASDLWLACACARGDERAIAEMERVHAGDVRAVYAQVRGVKVPFEELAQVLRTKLFVGERPKIAEYSGVGELKAWLRVTGVRTLVDMARAAPDKERPFEEEGPVAVPSPGDDPETQYLKRTYHAEMRKAFEDAAAQLSAEERNVLREHYAHGLSIDQIAAAHGIHRATAARRIAGAREALLRGTRQLLMQRLKMTRAELESVVRMIESQMHVTVERVFGGGE
jgi:RNA polymerase sigma-70 factor (ECF subfamily)